MVWLVRMSGFLALWRLVFGLICELVISVVIVFVSVLDFGCWFMVVGTSFLGEFACCFGLVVGGLFVSGVAGCVLGCLDWCFGGC